jgi:hypothetical protein
VCFNYNLPKYRDQVLAPYAPGGGGCQRFAEPVLFPLLYNSNLLVFTKGIFEAAKIYEIVDMKANGIRENYERMKMKDTLWGAEIYGSAAK